MHVAPGAKFAVFFLSRCQVGADLPTEEELQPGIWMSRQLGLQIADHWRQWLGSLVTDDCPKLGAMVRLDALDGHRQAAAHFLDEVSGRFDRVVSIDPKHAIPGGLIDGRELVEAAAAEFQVLDVDLDRLSRDVDLAPASGAWAIAFQGDPGDPLPLQDPLDGRRGDIDLVIPLPLNPVGPPAA